MRSRDRPYAGKANELLSSLNKAAKKPKSAEPAPAGQPKVAAVGGAFIMLTLSPP